MNSAQAGAAISIRAENLLLAALSEADYRRLRALMDFVRLPPGHVLFEAGESVAHAYFPTSGTVSLLTQLENGASAGIALIGNEGLTGMSVILEGRRARGPRYRAVVQNAGYAYRMPADCLLQEIDRGGALQHLVLRATLAQIAQIAQIGVCNRFHKLSERLCSWLLRCHDRLSGDEIHVTQSVLSCLLGVRREGVTEAAGRLQGEGAIEYDRGCIHVVDRPAVEQRACECYAAVTREYARLSPASAQRHVV